MSPFDEAIEFLNENSAAVQAIATASLALLSAFYVVFTLRLVHANNQVHLRPHWVPSRGSSSFSIVSHGSRAVDVEVDTYVVAPPAMKGKWLAATGNPIVSGKEEFSWQGHLDRLSPVRIQGRTITGLRQTTYWRWPQQGKDRDSTRFVRLSRLEYCRERTKSWFRWLKYKIPDDVKG